MHNPAQPYRVGSSRDDRPGTPNRNQYRSALFTTTEQQRTEAETRIAALQASGQYPDGIVTQLHPAPPFWRAEERHQQYFAKRNIEPKAL